MRFGRRLIAVGALVLTAGHAALLAAAAASGAGSTIALLAPGLLLVGAGMGACITPLTTTVLAAVDCEHAGAVSGVLSSMQQVGNALGVAVTGAIFFGALHRGVGYAFEDIVSANDALEILTGGVDPALLEPPANALRVALHPNGMAPYTLNFAEWSAHIVHRLHRRAVVTGDPRQERLYEELRRYPDVRVDPPPIEGIGGEIVVPLRLRRDGRELSFLTTVATFGTATDITLAGLAIEAFYPADAQTANILLAGL